jgi:hypothetical protein
MAHHTLMGNQPRLYSMRIIQQRDSSELCLYRQMHASYLFLDCHGAPFLPSPHKDDRTLC